MNLVYGYELEEEYVALNELGAVITEEQTAALDELYELIETIGSFDEVDVLVPEPDFEDYARDLAQDLLGDVFEQWPVTAVDWTQAAEELSVEYTSVEFRGEYYLTRV